MKRTALSCLLLALGWVCFCGTSSAAEQHRATRLGNPATRFAPPLTEPEQLRALFRDPRLERDIASILRQWGWTGDLADLHRAAQTAEITQIQIPVGATMPFMSSRENGVPVTLRNVLWAGKEPVSAYAFTFSSKGRRYRCVTPKACSNFFLEDLGPESPNLQLIKTAPREASMCDPIEMTMVVRNAGGTTLTNIQITDPLPAGMRTLDDQTTLKFEVATLAAGAGREFRYQVLANAAGSFVNVARASSSAGGQAEATATTAVRAPALALECAAAAEGQVGRPVELCLTVSNRGDAPEPLATVELPIPPAARVISTTEGGVASDGLVRWELANLAPDGRKRVCVVIATRQPGALSLTATASGRCAQPVQSQCPLQIAGVPAILLEVVDLIDPIQVGEEVTYEIKVTNQGSAVLHDIQLLFTLPASQQWVSGTGSTPARTDAGAARTEILPVLEPKAVATWRVLVKSVDAGDARFKVELRCNEFDEPILEDEATQQY